MTPSRYVCIHGHFYQPPRENPWLETVERQDSAAPYHDWNERIAAECYAPNARSRILDAQGRIARIVNNYARMSFNFGPTLLSWLERHNPSTYAAILDADRQSQRRFSGHGNALAQVYNHIIMPLANSRDRRTQVRWGLADFERRFGRPAEGIWLAETAVDLETLDILASEAVRFTILSPHQARRFRVIGGKEKDWHDVLGGSIDPTRAYLCRLPSGRAIVLFFYDAPVSQAVAFEGLLRSGERFADRLLNGFPISRDGPQLMHIATDGETYGHHFPHGDMALAHALEVIDARPQIRLTNYGEFLERHLPTAEVEIIEGSAWSCAHGVGRWRSDCGCRMRSDWQQQWRGPLRDALDGLCDRLARDYESAMEPIFPDPWDLRDQSIQLILDRDPKQTDAFLDRFARRPLTADERTTAIRWLEVQRNALLMYTSCGWFFDEISGIEGVQILQYAARAIQLAEGLTGRAFEPEFLDTLALAQSNLPHLGTGRQVYEKFVAPTRVDLTHVAAHFAVSSLFESYPSASRIESYVAVSEDLHWRTVNQARLVTGRVTVTSELTRERESFAFAAVHFGETNLSGGVRRLESLADSAEQRRAVEEAFARFDLAEVVRILDREFNARAYSLRSLFRDEQEKILAQLLQPAATSMEDALRRIFDSHAPAMRFLAALDRPTLPAFRMAAEFVVNRDIERALLADPPDPHQLARLAAEAKALGVRLDQRTLTYRLGECVARQLAKITAHPGDVALIRSTEALIAQSARLDLPSDFWAAANSFSDLLHSEYAVRRKAGDAAWCEAFTALGVRLGMRVEPESPAEI